MQVTRKVAPGQKDAKKSLDQDGLKLACERYRICCTQFNIWTISTPIGG